MKREDQLKFCKACHHQGFDPLQGITCQLTNNVADFEDNCASFSEIENLKETSCAKKHETEINKNLASQSKRFLNYILDSIFYMIFLFVALIYIGLTNTGIFNKIFIENKLLSYFVIYSIFVIYFIATEGLTGKTIAKYITKTTVVNAAGQKPDAKTCFIRTICRFIPFEAFSYLGSDYYGWHDRLSKTYVVDDTFDMN